MEQLLLLLKWLAASGAGVFASWILDQWGEFDSFNKETKRIISIVTTGTVGTVAVALAAVLGSIFGTVEMPVDLAGWVVLVANAAAAAIMAGHARHTVIMIKKK